jgi:OOP family OmpA-OmpF porin
LKVLPTNIGLLPNLLSGFVLHRPLAPRKTLPALHVKPIRAPYGLRPANRPQVLEPTTLSGCRDGPAWKLLGCCRVSLHPQPEDELMKSPRALRRALLLAAAIAPLFAAPAVEAQPGSANWAAPVSGGQIWRNNFGQCWRAGYWTPAHAIAECDPDLVAKPVAVKPPPPPVAKPAPPPPKPVPAMEKVQFAADTLFDFDKSVIKPEGRRTLDDLVEKIKGIDLEVIIAVGHTDSIGSDAYNQRLSERRAHAVSAYLQSRGIDPSRIKVEGRGEKQPVAPNRVNGRDNPEGRQKNRRVEIEVIGTRKR